MIKRLSNTITRTKDWFFRHTAARCLWYLAVVLALLLFWLYTDRAEISFVYNAF